MLGLRRWARRLDRVVPVTTGTEAMVGRTAEVVEPCRPRGTVMIDGELWEALCADGADRGESVRIDDVDRLRLTVSSLAAP